MFETAPSQPLPPLVEKEAVPAERIAPVAPEFLTLAEAAEVEVTFVSELALRKSALGAFTVGADGRFGPVDLVFGDTSSTRFDPALPRVLDGQGSLVEGVTTVSLGSFAAGTPLGFVLVSDAARLNGPIDPEGTYALRTASGEPAGSGSTGPLRLVQVLPDGTERPIAGEVLVTTDPTPDTEVNPLNAGGRTQVLAGVDQGGDLLLAFEDLARPGGDSDFNDVMIRVTSDGAGSPVITPPSSFADLGTQGFKIQGENAYDRAGSSVAPAGDINDDGLDDLLIGANGNDSGGYDAGAAYVVFSRTGGLGSLVDLDQIAQGNGGFKIQGEDASDLAGNFVSSAGDVNGDGFADLLIAAPGNDSGGDRAGAAYVVYGRAEGLGPLVDLDQVAQGIGGFKIQGENAGDLAGFRVSSAGDVNGDGFDDVLIGAPYNDSGGTWAGAAYVLFGRTDSLGPVVDLDQIAQGNGGFKIQGEDEFDRAGSSVALAGDVNDDGFEDLLVGAYFSSSGGMFAGAAYVVYGRDGGFGPLVDLGQVAQGNGGFKIQGENTFDFAGLSAASAGDVNGDGLDDLLVAGRGNDSGGSYAGAAYVVYGRAEGLGPLIDLDQVAQGIGGFKIQGENAYDRASSSVASAGDVNGDGFDDLLIGAQGNDSGGDYAGAAYVVYGRAGGFAPLIDLDQVAQGIGGFKIQGETATDVAGGSVASAGDVNGDGFDDLLVGALNNESGGQSAGAAYVVYGGNFAGAVSQPGAAVGPEDGLDLPTSGAATLLLDPAGSMALL